MSALLVDDLIVPTAAEDVRWRHVRSAQATNVVALPGVAASPRPVRPVATAGARPAQLQLTDRGIAVVVGFFAAIFLGALTVLVVGFFAVSDAPAAPAQHSSVLVSQG